MIGYPPNMLKFRMQIFAFPLSPLSLSLCLSPRPTMRRVVPFASASARPGNQTGSNT